MTAIASVDTVLDTCESAVRSYCRSFPAVFSTAKDDLLTADDGSRFLDFLSGAGTLNYGHNPDVLKNQVIDYLQRDGVLHGLDLATSAKADFLTAFRDLILVPRDYDYRVQFCSPSGTNAVEAALKLARLVTDRTNVVCFSGAFHGVSTGSLAVTSSDYYRHGLYATLAATTRIPYPDSPVGEFDSLDLLDRMLRDCSSGVEKPAAVLVETVQGEGGVYIASAEFLRGLRALCTEHAILLVVDDIQAGCGRTGAFFSFERAEIQPDLITLSKSIGGYGLPMALLLIRPDLDIWQPGQHNGTFRGNQLAFVAGAAALRAFWADDNFATQVIDKGRLVAELLAPLTALGVVLRGLGLMWGVDLSAVPELDAGAISRRCFEQGLIIETCGRDGSVLKVLPPLTINRANLAHGLCLIRDTILESMVTDRVAS